MPDLLIERLSFNEQQISHTDMDYFEHIIVKLTKKISNPATHKRYGAFFTCLTTRAVHLELASELSRDVFILALRCFIAHCGKPKEVLCDNSTNFIGTD